MILFEHHFDRWEEGVRKPTGKYRIRTTWYGRQVAQIEEVVAYSRRPSIYFTNAKTETEWRDLKKAELNGKHFVCLH